MSYERIIAAVMAEPWAILPSKLRAIETVLSDRVRGVRYSAEEIEAKIGGAKAAAIARKAGAVAVLPIHGTISHRIGSMDESSGGISTERVSGWLRAAVADEGVKAIVLDIDSPGGSVSGVEELAREIYAARERKPIVAVANAMAASAAYWLGAQADELLVTPSGSVGSIGVYAAHVDQSRALDAAGVSVTLVHAGAHKVEGNPYAPLDEEARAEMQAKVDGAYKLFTSAVKRGRPGVSSDVMQGRMYLPDEAKRTGLVDGIATLDETIARFGGAPSQRSGMRAEQIQIERMRLELDEM